MVITPEGERRQIAQLEDLDAAVLAKKMSLLKEADEAMALVNLGADLLLASAVAGDADDEAAMTSRLTRYTMALVGAEEHEVQRYTQDGLRGPREFVVSFVAPFGQSRVPPSHLRAQRPWVESSSAEAPSHGFRRP